MREGNTNAIKPGRSRTKLYNSWNTMIQRCTNPNNKNYPWYGGRGVEVCLEWHHFENFLEDMGKRPEGMSLGRIDNDGPYCKDNCRWATAKQQAQNRRSCHLLEYAGKIHSIMEWSKLLGIPHSVLYGRIRHGWSVEKALTTI